MVALSGTCAAFSIVEAVSELWNRAKPTPLMTKLVLVSIYPLLSFLSEGCSNDTLVHCFE